MESSWCLQATPCAHFNSIKPSCLRAITLICLPPSLHGNISAVGGVDLLHLMAPPLPGREQCSPAGCRPDQLECLLGSKPTHTQLQTEPSAETEHLRRCTSPLAVTYDVFLLFMLTCRRRVGSCCDKSCAACVNNGAVTV